jgi:hypothetical protein
MEDIERRQREMEDIEMLDAVGQFEAEAGPREEMPVSKGECEDSGERRCEAQGRGGKTGADLLACYFRSTLIQMVAMKSPSQMTRVSSCSSDSPASPLGLLEHTGVKALKW